MIKLGVMQGRLSPPKGNLIQHFPSKNWANEFKLCQHLGLESIEWVFENENYLENPIFDLKKLNQISDLTKKFDIKVNSVVADYFMQNKLFDEKKDDIQKNVDVLKKLIINCKKIGTKIIEIPLVDSSSIKNKNHINELRENLKEPLNLIEKNNMYLSLETDLDPNNFKKLIEEFHPKKVFVNYDMGNSASLGYNPEIEIETLKNYIINVHIKDRLFKGSTVPLGKGSVNFDVVFKKLKEINYQGDFILQTARLDLPQSEVKEKFEQTIKKNINFIKKYSYE